jgi:hypothetical protein
LEQQSRVGVVGRQECQSVSRHLQLGNRAEQPLRIGVMGLFKEVRGRPHLHNTSWFIYQSRQRYDLGDGWRQGSYRQPIF